MIVFEIDGNKIIYDEQYNVSLKGDVEFFDKLDEEITGSVTASVTASRRCASAIPKI